MKKKIVSVAIVAAVAVAAAWGFNQSKNEMALSDVALSNVEALAQDESGEGGGSGSGSGSGAYSCTISRDCGGGATVACTGANECKHISGPLGSLAGKGVSCDGRVTRCP